ncbi:Vacuolar amino acid transporter 4 [Trichostrongylus colubriformis]|uniref:Vacuolar amino acid transporter 4 n=1 Tax=Trichostrongylus colubriformis TaxID=6319 RepID=A0AAN8I8F3_TRICO
MSWNTEDEKVPSTENGFFKPVKRDSSSLNSMMDMSRPFMNPKGLSWFVTALFVVGDLAGGGLVALPTAMIQSEFYPGLAISVVMMAVVTYTAYVLGLSWNILLNTWPEYREHCRKPYPEIGYRAMGRIVKLLVSICIDITQFGIAVVYLLLASKNIHDMIKTFSDAEFSYCFVVIILAVCLLPITFLKSPQDFWWAVVLAMITTSCAVVLIIVGASLDYGLCSGYTGMPSYQPKNFFLALGTLLFAYGGHSAFPTIQHDMKNPAEFTKSVILAFTIMGIMYGPVCIMGYLTYHDAIRDSIIPSIQTVWIQQAINILITVHCILTLTIVFNPLNQELEDLFRCPHHFGWQRALIRTGTMMAVAFVAESIPNFGPLLDLFGGSTLTLTSVILPCLFYLYLNARLEKEKYSGKKDDSPATLGEVFKYNPRATLFICVGIIVFGLFGGAAATFSAIVELTTTNFLLPCYVSPFLHKELSQDLSLSHPSDNGASVYCCGAYQNLTHNGQTSQCVPMPSNPFYG